MDCFGTYFNVRVQRAKWRRKTKGTSITPKQDWNARRGCTINFSVCTLVPVTMYGKCWRHTLQTVWPAKAKDNLILRSSSMLVNGNGGLKIPHALTCARSQQKCSEGRLDKTTTKMQPIPQRNEKRLKKQTPFSRPKRYGHVTIPCKWRCFSDVFFLPAVNTQISGKFWHFNV